MHIYEHIYVNSYVLPAQVKYFTLQARSCAEIKCDCCSSIDRSIPALFPFPWRLIYICETAEMNKEILKILWQNVNEARVQAMNSGHQRVANRKPSRARGMPERGQAAKRTASKWVEPALDVL